MSPQSSSSGAPWRGLGPPACLAIMIWSTLRTVATASVASFRAHHCTETAHSMFLSSASTSSIELQVLRLPDADLGSEEVHYANGREVLRSACLDVQPRLCLSGGVRRFQLPDHLCRVQPRVLCDDADNNLHGSKLLTMPGSG